MKLFTILLFSIIAFYQAKAACVEELMELFINDVANTELKMNTTEVDINQKIQTTANEVEKIIKETQNGIQSEREKLDDLQAAAYGKSLTKKKSIADCLEHVRVEMKLINATESVIYSVCRADLSLLLVRLSTVSINRVSKKLQEDLKICMENYEADCEKEKACVIKSLQEANTELNNFNLKVENKLDNIFKNSQICADGKKDIVISMIKEQESKFNYCVESILKS